MAPDADKTNAEVWLLLVAADANRAEAAKENKSEAEDSLIGSNTILVAAL